MFKNRVQISRLSGVDGLVCDAGNLELDALVNCIYITSLTSSHSIL